MTWTTTKSDNRQQHGIRRGEEEPTLSLFYLLLYLILPEFKIIYTVRHYADPDSADFRFLEKNEAIEVLSVGVPGS